MKLLNKVTIKNVLGKKPNGALLGDAQEFDIMTVYGTVKDSKPGVHTFGDGKESLYIKFFGDIRAVRSSDGVEFRSREVILPNLAEGVLAPVVEGLDKDAGESVRFAFQIGMRKAETATGYEFTAEPLVESEEHDPLKDFRAQLLTGRKAAALAAPPDKGTPDTVEAVTEKPAPKKKAAAK